MASPQTIAEVLALLDLASPASVQDVAGRPFAPEPLAAEALAALAAQRLPDGSELPAELLEWLRVDASWFALDEEGQLRIETLRQIFARWAEQMADEIEGMAAEESGPLAWSSERMVEDWISMLPDGRLADAAAVEVDYIPGSQEHILILERGGVRVLACDKRLELWWKYHSLAGMVAHWLRLAPDAH